jgi:hypothetical protein
MPSRESASPSTGSPPGERFRLGSEFASNEVEQQFRQSALASNRVVGKWCILATILATGLFLSADYRLFGPSAQFLLLVCVRSLAIILSVLALIGIRRAQTPASFNAILWSWTMLIALGTIYINATRPATYSAHIIVTVEMVLLTYCVVPLPLTLQMLTASVNTIAGPVLHYWIDPQGQGMSQSAVLQAYTVANLVGIITSIQLHRRKRQLFAAAIQQQELTANLEQALAEIRTLHGILPICAHCKRVMNDAGAWEQIEDYVRKHTHAQFTHDICPECAQKHYGKYAD